MEDEMHPELCTIDPNSLQLYGTETDQLRVHVELRNLMLVKLTSIRNVLQNKAFWFIGKEKMPSTAESLRSFSRTFGRLFGYTVRCCFFTDRLVHHVALQTLRDIFESCMKIYSDENARNLAIEEIKLNLTKLDDFRGQSFQLRIESLTFLCRSCRDIVKQYGVSLSLDPWFELLKFFMLSCDFMAKEKEKINTDTGLPSPFIRLQFSSIFKLTCSLSKVLLTLSNYKNEEVVSFASHTKDMLENVATFFPEVLRAVALDFSDDSYLTMEVIKAFTCVTQVVAKTRQTDSVLTVCNGETFLKLMACDEVIDFVHNIMINGFEVDSDHQALPNCYEVELTRKTLVFVLELTCLLKVLTESHELVQDRREQILRLLHEYFKSRPSAPWHFIINTLLDQDDDLLRGLSMLLEIFMGLRGAQEEFRKELTSWINPHFLFFEFLAAVSFDGTLLLDLLIGTNSPFTVFLISYLTEIVNNFGYFCTSVAAIAAYKRLCTTCAHYFQNDLGKHIWLHEEPTSGEDTDNSNDESSNCEEFGNLNQCEIKLCPTKERDYSKEKTSKSDYSSVPSLVSYSSPDEDSCDSENLSQGHMNGLTPSLPLVALCEPCDLYAGRLLNTLIQLHTSIKASKSNGTLQDTSLSLTSCLAKFESLLHQ